MIYWNQQENPNLDFDKWDYSGIGANTEYDFKYLLKYNGNKSKILEDIVIEYIKEFKKYLDLYNIPYSVDYLWSSYNTETINHIEKVCINIYYPEITITNGKEQEKLLDLYFGICFTKDGYFCLKGTRETYSEKHCMYNYTHSHLPSSTVYTRFDNNFCLGSGILSSLNSLINGSIHYANSSNKYSLRHDCVKSIIMNIKPYLEWESEAGGPYIRMNSIGIKKVDLLSHDYEINYENENLNFIKRNKFVLFICKNINLSNLKFKLENSNNLRLFKLVINKEFIIELEKTISTYDMINNPVIKTCTYKFINNELYEFDADRQINKEYINKPIFIRNHETIYRKVIKTENDLNKGKVYNLVSQNYLKSIITSIEYLYNYNAQLKIKNYNNDRTSTIGEQQIQEIN